MKAVRTAGVRGAPDASVTAGRLLERGRGVQRTAQSLGDSIEGLLSDAEAFVRGNLEQHPYATLGAAAGVGFVIGGGLSPRLLAGIALMSGRAVAFAALQGTLLRSLGIDGEASRESADPAIAKEDA